MNRTETNIKRLGELLDKMVKSKNRPKKFVDADTEFHVALARATGNTAFVVLVQAIIQLLRKERSYTLDFKDEHDSAIAFHKEILYRVREKDEEGTELAMRSHLKHVGHVLQPLNK